MFVIPKPVELIDGAAGTTGATRAVMTCSAADGGTFCGFGIGPWAAGLAVEIDCPRGEEELGAALAHKHLYLRLLRNEAIAHFVVRDII